jgi:hypothetical protein
MKVNWKKLLIYVLGLGTVGSTPALLLESGIFSESRPATSPDNLIMLPPKSEKLLVSDSIEADEWEEIFRSSDLEAEKATQPRYYAPRKNWENKETKPAPKDGQRIGCVCMDGHTKGQRGKGACSGQGGVRFWVYRMPDSTVLRHATWRHDQHPEPLVADELTKLDSRNKASRPTVYDGPPADELELISEALTVVKKDSTLTEVIYKARHEKNEQAEDQAQRGLWGFYDMIIMIMVCITVAFVTHTLFARR